MSKYTTEVRFICETCAGYDMSQGYGKVSEILNNSWDKIFDFDFPIFDEDYRSVLCKKILLHYYTREIGLETVGLWKLKLMTKLNEVMPYFNKLYLSEQLEFNPLYDADYTKEHEGSGAGNSEDTGTNSMQGTGTHTGTIGDVETHHDSDVDWNLFSDTPQNGLQPVDDGTYLTDARKQTHENTGGRNNTRTFNENTTDARTGTNNVSREYSNTDEYIEHIKGKFPGKSYAKMIEEYRGILLNVDMQVIDSLRDLFMKVW